MTTQILLPKLGFSMNEAVLVEWMAEDGAQVSKGQPLYAIESEKSLQEIEAPADGTLRIIEQAGDTYEIGTVIGEIA